MQLETAPIVNHTRNQRVGVRQVTTRQINTQHARHVEAVNEASASRGKKRKTNLKEIKSECNNNNNTTKPLKKACKRRRAPAEPKSLEPKQQITNEKKEQAQTKHANQSCVEATQRGERSPLQQQPQPQPAAQAQPQDSACDSTTQQCDAELLVGYYSTSSVADKAYTYTLGILPISRDETGEWELYEDFDSSKATDHHGRAKRIRTIWSGVYSLLPDKRDGFSWIQFTKTREIVQENCSREEKVCSAVGSCPYGVLLVEEPNGRDMSTTTSTTTTVTATTTSKMMGIMVNAFGRTHGLLFTRPL